MTETREGRLKAVREALGLTQLQFLPRLNQAAVKLGVREYSQSTLSKLETGAQDASFDDILVYELVDPLHRGRLWLAWGSDGGRAPALKVAEPVRPVMPEGSFTRAPTSKSIAKKAAAKKRRRA